jgi:hypothetical protein
MNKENIEKTSDWLSELGELIPVRYNKKTHKAILTKPTEGIDKYVRKLNPTILVNLKDLDLSSDLEIPKGTNPIQIKENNNEN